MFQTYEATSTGTDWRLSLPRPQLCSSSWSQFSASHACVQFQPRYQQVNLQPKVLMGRDALDLFNKVFRPLLERNIWSKMLWGPKTWESPGRMSPPGWSIWCVLLAAHMSACDLEISGYDSNGVICSQVGYCRARRLDTLKQTFPVLQYSKYSFFSWQITLLISF